MNFNVWVILGVLIVVVLAIYAASLYIKLYQLKAERKKQQVKLDKEQQERREYCRKSIWIIAGSLVEKQMSLTEGAIRISVLSSQLDLSSEEQNDYDVFKQLAEATAHIPILDEWKKLKTREKLKYDKEREVIEEKFRDFVINAAKEIVKKSAEIGVEPLFYRA